MGQLAPSLGQIMCEMKAHVPLPMEHPHFYWAWKWNMNTTGLQLFFSCTTSVRICPKGAWFWQFPLLTTHFSGIPVSFPNQNLKAGTAGSSENCGSFKSQLVMRKQSVGWMLFAVIHACPTPQKFKDSSCDPFCLDFKLGWHAEAAWRAWIWQQRNFRSISYEGCTQDGRNLNLLAVFPRGTG